MKRIASRKKGGIISLLKNLTPVIKLLKICYEIIARTILLYVWLCMYGYVCTAMNVWLCMHSYVCMSMYVWLCMYGYACMAMYVWLCMAMYGYVSMAMCVWLCIYGYV